MRQNQHGSAGTTIMIVVVLLAIAIGAVALVEGGASQERTQRAAIKERQDRAEFEAKMQAAKEAREKEEGEREAASCLSSRTRNPLEISYKCFACDGRGVQFGTGDVAKKCRCCLGTGSHK